MANIKRNPLTTEIGSGNGGIGTPSVDIPVLSRNEVATPYVAPGVGADKRPNAVGDGNVGNKPEIPTAGIIGGAAAGALPATGAITPPEPTPNPTPAPAPVPAPGAGGTVGEAPQTFPTNPGWGMGSGAGTQLPSATDYSDMINEMYAMQQEQMMAQAQAEYDRAIAELEHGRAQIPGYYQSAARTAAGQNAIERRAMNEQFAAMGLNTGTHGQAALSHSIAGQNQQAAIRQAEADALAEIEFARAQMMAEYQAAVRDAILSNNIAKAEALYNEALRLDQAAVQNAMNQAQLDYQARMEELAMLEARAEMLASIGDFSGYAALGYSAEEIAALEAAWQRENAVPSGGGGYTGGGGGNYGYDTHGMSDAEIRALQAAAGIAVDGIWGPDTEAAYQAMQAGLGTPTPTEPEQPVQPQSNPLVSSHSQILYGAIANETMSYDQIKLLLESYYGNGWISEAEADYLLSIMGF